MFLRALFALLALPGVFAGVVPWLIIQADTARSERFSAALPLIVAGIFILLWCVRDFLVIGRGTLAPWDPPKRLVAVGLYRIVRNPMYVGITIYLIGLSLWSGSRWLWLYLAVLVIAFHLRILLFEEPRLAALFPDDWENYKRTVPRWLPRFSNLRKRE